MGFKGGWKNCAKEASLIKNTMLYTSVMRFQGNELCSTLFISLHERPTFLLFS